MDDSGGVPAVSEHSPTTHAMLIVWGHFARAIGLVDRLAGVPIPQKTVVHAPQAKLTEFLIGLLSGIEYLSDLSEGATPLVADREVALAWQLAAMADASSVSRTLKLCDEGRVAALQAALDAVAQPFRDRALADLRERNEPLILDADLTGRPVSSTSRTYPGAAFGYMDGSVRLGYQLAEICLHTRLFERQWLSARHHPGNRVSSECLLELIHDAERLLGCHPQRRPERVAERLAGCEQSVAEGERLMRHQEHRATASAKRIARLNRQIQAAQEEIHRLQEAPVSARRGGPKSVLCRRQQQVADGKANARGQGGSGNTRLGWRSAIGSGSWPTPPSGSGCASAGCGCSRRTRVNPIRRAARSASMPALARARTSPP